MSINRTVVKLWIAVVHLTNGQTVEIEVRAKTIREAKEVLKKDAHIKKIVSVKKPKI